MSYAVLQNAPEVPVPVGSRVKSPEREAMERLQVGDAILITDAERVRTARDARYRLQPRKFTVRKIAGKGWQVRRTQ